MAALAMSTSMRKSGTLLEIMVRMADQAASLSGMLPSRSGSSQTRIRDAVFKGGP